MNKNGKFSKMEKGSLKKLAKQEGIAGVVT